MYLEEDVYTRARRAHARLKPLRRGAARFLAGLYSQQSRSFTLAIISSSFPGLPRAFLSTDIRPALREIFTIERECSA